MFSIEDLLISHGYKLPTNAPKPYANTSDGCHYEIAQRRSGHGTLNGYETDSGVCSINRNPCVKSYCSDNEDNQGSQKRQTSAASSNRDQGGVDKLHTSEVGLCDRVPLARSSRPKTDKDIAYWRRRGQDFSVLFGYSEKGDTETKGSSTETSKGISQTNGGLGTAKEDLPEAGKGTRNIMQRDVMDESPKASIGYQQQGLNIETQKHHTQSEKQMAGGEGETLFQDLYALTLGNNDLSSLCKGKSQLLPKVPSPENMWHVDLPVLSSGNQFSRDNDIMPYCNQGIHLHLNKNSKTWNHVQNLPKPKYSRPLKPPSYQLCQQTKGPVELGGFQEDQQKDEHSPLFININEPSHDSYIQDSVIEPPVYVPPPSYKSPTEQHVKDKSFPEVPKYDVCFNDAQRQHWVESPSLKPQLPTNNSGTYGKYCTDKHIPYGKDNHNTHVDHYSSSIQYIPFDDPRIRHIKIGHDDGHHYDSKQMENASWVGHRVLQGKYIQKLQQDSAFLDPPNVLNSLTYDTMTAGSANSNMLLGTSINDKEMHGLLDQRDGVTTRYERADREHNDIKVNLPWKEESSHEACETATKVKKFEAESKIQCKISSRKKLNETIFCLVSVPVTASSGPSDTDKNNNDLTHSEEKIDEVDDSSVFFHEQRLLSSSSTDLELQALTGSMTNKDGLEKQEQYRQEEYKQTHDLRIIKHKKHRELKYSGSWPGDQCRDQKTQTIFSQEPRNSQCFPYTKLNRPNDTSPDPNCIASVPVIGSKKPAESYSQNMYNIKGQMYFNPSINSAFSRTMSSANVLLKPKAHQSQLYGTTSTTTNGKGQITITKGEVVKGEVAATCNSKELFGQFLLKPASRRPCDAISELEIFNKELQERESGQTGEGMDNKEEHRQEQAFMDMLNSDTNYESNMQIKIETKPRMKVQVAPILKPGRVKSKSESWSTDLETDNLQSFSGLELPLPAQERRGQSPRSPDGNALREIKIRDLEAENNKNKESILSANPAPIHRLWSSNSMKANKTKLLPIGSFQNTYKDQLCNDDVMLGYKKQSKTALPENKQLVGKGPNIRLSAVNRNKGLSEADLSIFCINGSPQPGRNVSGEFHEKQATLEIPENESLQERAVRILGIEVAVDSLASNSAGTRQGCHLNSEIRCLDPEYSEAEILNGTMQTKGGTDHKSFVGAGKYGLKKSSVSEGDMDIVSNSLPQTVAFQKFNSNNDVSMSPGNDLSQLKLEELEQDRSVFRQSIPFYIDKKKAVTSSAERKTRSTSKMIETLQEKLASTPKRTAVDRLVRMTEVHSVSRMRRLSIKRSDSGDEADDEKELHNAEEEEGRRLTFGRNELSHTIAVQACAVPKRTISLDEGANARTKDKKKFEEDVFYLDAYDPTRVERV